MSTSSQTKAFTLIELLMVITIVSILMSMTFVVMGIIKHQADRTHCAVKLKNWGIALMSYQAENQRFPQPISSNSNSFNPGIWLKLPIGQNQHELSVETLENYAGTGQSDTSAIINGRDRLKLGKMLLCPTYRTLSGNTTAGTVLVKTGSPLQPEALMIHANYAYYGNVDSWNKAIDEVRAGRDDSIINPLMRANATDRVPDPKRILMQDYFYAAPDKRWIGTNHYARQTPRSVVTLGTAEGITKYLEGANILVADGRVFFRKVLPAERVTIATNGNGLPFHQVQQILRWRLYMLPNLD